MHGDGNKGNLQYLVGNHLDRMSLSVTDARGDAAQIDQEVMFLDDLAHAVLHDNDAFLQEWAEIHEPRESDRERGPEAIHAAKRHREIRCIIKHLYANNVLRRAPLDVEDVGDL